jgi:hypothetical protein
MAPTELERLATLEAKAKTSDDLLKEVRRELKRLPGRIGRRTAHQLAECRAIQDGKRVTGNGKPAAKDDDYGWLKKLLVVGMTIGTLIGGAVYQVAQEAGRKPPAISQGGNP